MNNHLLQLCFSLLVGISLSSVSFAQTDVENLYDENSKQTLSRQAGNYSEKNGVLTIAVYRGVENRDQYDDFIIAVDKKLTEKAVPHKFFQKFNDRPGTVFLYFIENDMNGSFDVEEFTAILPHAVRRYKEQYPN